MSCERQNFIIEIVVACRGCRTYYGPFYPGMVLLILDVDTIVTYTKASYSGTLYGGTKDFGHYRGVATKQGFYKYCFNGVGIMQDEWPLL